MAYMSVVANCQMDTDTKYKNTTRFKRENVVALISPFSILILRKQEKINNGHYCESTSLVFLEQDSSRIYDFFLVLRSHKSLSPRTPTTKREQKCNKITKSVVLQSTPPPLNQLGDIIRTVHVTI